MLPSQEPFSDQLTKNLHLLGFILSVYYLPPIIFTFVNLFCGFYVSLAEMLAP